VSAAIAVGSAYAGECGCRPVSAAIALGSAIAVVAALAAALSCSRAYSMQIRDEHVVVVVVVVVRRVVVVVVVVVVRRVVVVVVVVVSSSGSDSAVVVVVVVVVLDGVDDSEDAAVVVVAVAPVVREAGGIGSTAPNSDGFSGTSSSVRVPKAKRVHTMAPTTAPTASRP
jgi:hypothetical protein